MAMKKIAGILGKTIDYTVDWSSNLAGCFLLIIAFATTYEVISRYAFNSPTSWTLDLSVYMLIWFAYASIASLQEASAPHPGRFAGQSLLSPDPASLGNHHQHHIFGFYLMDGLLCDRLCRLLLPEQ